MSILFDERWVGTHGIGRFAEEIYSRLKPVPAGLRGKPWSPIDPLRLTRMLASRRETFFYTPGYNAPIGRPCPFAFTLHDLNHLAVDKNSSFAKRAYYEYVIRPAVRRAEVVVTVSDFSKAEIVAWTGVRDEKVVNVSNGVSAAFCVVSSPPTARGSEYFLSFASDKWHKNVLGLLRAYALSACKADVELHLVGVPCASLRNAARDLGIESQLKFLGKLSDLQLANTYRRAIALVFVSHYEGFGLPIVEAMACGTPVITSSTTATGEVAGTDAILVDPTSSDCIANALDRVAQSTTLQAELRLKGINRAASFSWEKTAAKVYASLHSAMKL